MKGKVFWLVTSCLVVLSLVLVACAPKAPEVTPAAPKETAPTAPKEVAPTVPTAEKPEYGGTIKIALDTDLLGRTLDEVYFRGTEWGLPNNAVFEDLLMADWSLGPAGSGKTDFVSAGASGFSPDGFLTETGALAESWDIPNAKTIIFKIRQGVNWQNKPPVNGREFTAADVVFSLRRMYLNPDIPVTQHVRRMVTKVTDVYVDPADKWTVVVKVSDMATAWLEEVGELVKMVAPEVITKYGNNSDWRNLVGTGAFIYADYVAGSSGTFVRNPNYWLKNPVGPGKGDQLPYLDGFTALIIPDISTRITAFRTGKVDFSGAADVGLEDVSALKTTNPEIITKVNYGTPDGFAINQKSTDPLSAPFKNKRVRQAMAMAIDNEAIVKYFHGGAANNLQYFFVPGSPYYTPLEQMPEIVQKMYGYHPEEAKKILAEEGYPDGFKTEIMVVVADVDLFSLVKDYWRKNLNVDLALDVRQSAVVTSMRTARQYRALINSSGVTTGYMEKWLRYTPGLEGNRAEVDDPKVNDAIARANAVYGDIGARSKIMQDIEPYIIEQAWYVQLPSPATYNIVQPWVKNNYGISRVGYQSAYNFVIFAWVDQELKKEMGVK